MKTTSEDMNDTIDISKDINKLLDNMGNAICVSEIDTDGKIVISYFSKAFADLCESDQDTVKKEFAKNPFNGLEKDNLIYFRDVLEELIKVGGSKELTYRFRTFKGNLIWLQAKLKIVFMEDGRKTIYFTCFDVTEKIEMKEQLQNLVDNAPGGICLYKYAGEKLYPIFMSNAFSDLYGVEKQHFEDGIKSLHYKYVHPDDLEWLSDSIKKNINKPNSSGHFKYRVWNELKQKYIWISAHAKSIQQDDGSLLIYVAYADNTNEIELLEKLKDSNSKLKREEEIREAASRFAGMWNFKFDIKNDVVYSNSLLQENYNIPEKIENFPEGFLDYNCILPEYENIYREAVAKIKNGADESEMIVQTKYSDGSIHWIRIRINRLLQNETNEEYAIGSALPIDQEMALEKRLEMERQKTVQYDPKLLRFLVFNVSKNQLVEYRTFREGVAKAVVGESIEHVLFNVNEKAYHDKNWEKYKSIHDCKKLIELCEEGTTAIQLDGIHIDTDDSLLWIKNTLNLIREPSTGDVYLYEYTYDNNEQKMQEEILKASVKYGFERLASLSLKSGKMVWVSKQKDDGESILHTEDFETTYLSYCDAFVLPEDQEKYKRNILLKNVWDKLKTKREYEFTNRTLEDGMIHFKRTRFVKYDSLNDLVLVSRTDITQAFNEEEQKKMELQKSNEEKSALLMERERLYAALFSIVPMVISVNLTKNKYQMVNYDDFYAKSAKYSGKFDDLISVGAGTVPEEDRQMFIDTFSRKNLMEKYEQGSSAVTLEHRQYGDDGKIYWTETTVVFVKNEIDGDVYDITLAQNITERKNQQEQLNSALLRAEKANNFKSEFLAKMSHDLRTPINTIIGLQALALDDIQNPFEVKRYLDKMRDATDFMLGLINDLLDLHEIESGKVEIHKESYKYSDFVENMRTMFVPQCESKNISFEIEKIDINPIVLVDKIKLNRIFFNIFSNAVKYTPSGGSIIYKMDNIIIDEDKFKCDFVIKDNGIGMSKAFQEHMFDAFSQEDKNVKSDLQGSGVGLSITKQLVELLGGVISIDSKKGEGTKVTVSLSFDLITPYAEETKKKEEKMELMSSDIILKNKNVLLVEDHILNAEIARRSLEKKLIGVTWADNGQVAVEKFNASSENYYDAILMDVRMPVMNGLEATKKIRELDRADAKKVPIVAMSANAYEQDIEKSLNAGMNAHLAKPIEPKKIYQVLAAQIAKNSIQNLHSAADEKLKLGNILVVDDIEVNIAVLQCILEEDYNIFTASNGKIALEILNKNDNIDAVITDVQMPEMNGLELIEKIRMMDNGRNIAIIANTQYGDKNQVEDLINAGADEFIYKPTTPDIVIKSLEKVMKKKPQNKR